MNTPLISPKLDIDANLHDESATDNSITQGGVTINASGSATINSNSGNERKSSAFSSQFWIITISTFFDFILFMAIFWAHESSIIRQDVIHTETQMRLQRIINDNKEMLDKIKKDSDQMAQSANEGTIWILRRDILNSIDLHNETKTITRKQFKRIKDQFDYYISIGGNHDVQAAYDDFYTRIFGSGEIRMMN